MNKKLIPLTIILIISLTLGTVYSTSSFFNDVPNNAWYSNAINNLSNKKIMNGDNGNFKPNNYVTRAELAQTIHNMIEIGMFDSKPQIAYEDKIINTIFNTLQSTVTIETSKGVGSGVLISEDTILTAYHVIEGLSYADVTFITNGKHNATVIKIDPENDLALIKIRFGVLLEPIKFADDITVGQIAIAIGNPRGYGFTVSKGIVSHLNRVIAGVSHIQFDASISKGSSGGGLINSDGELIGIVVRKAMAEDVEGIGFAVPINTVKEFINK